MNEKEILKTQGKKAALRGLTEEECPYEDKELKESWLEGFRDVKFLAE